LVGHFVADCQRHGHWSLMQRLALLQVTGVSASSAFDQTLVELRQSMK
jgi:hypothetical protein